jgi:DNA-binding NtrC family response regulator
MVSLQKWEGLMKEEISEDSVRILIIDDDKGSQIAARQNIEKLFARLKAGELVIKDALSIEAGLRLLSEESFHIVFLDKDLGKTPWGKPISGIDHIKDILAIQPLTQIIMLTGNQSYFDITKAMKMGASDYLLKSNDEGISDYRDMIIHQAVKRAKDEIEAILKDKSKSTGLYSNYVSSAPAMQRFDQKVEAVAETPRSVLFLGPSGLGKGFGARRINQLRKKLLGQPKRPFVNINIGNISDELAQTELFGYEANSFTGAGDRARAGLIDAAQYGDIFLDEIGDASPEMQLKLLKVVEEGFFKRVGGRTEIKSNARFIFATNKDIKALVEAGKFRADLYHRISAFEIEVPPLEERKSDLEEIIKGIIRSVLKDLPHKRIAYEDFPDDLIQYLTRDNIPGNIRGIENDVLRLITLSRKDESGSLNLKDWRTTLGIDFKQQRKPKHAETIDIAVLRNFDSNLLTEDFPGIREVQDLLERKILHEAKAKRLSLTETARLMKISKSALCLRAKTQNFSFARSTLGE